MRGLPPDCVLRPLTPADLPAAQALLNACETYDSGAATVHYLDLATVSRGRRFDFERGSWAVETPQGDLGGAGWMYVPGGRGISLADWYVRPDLRPLGLDEVFVEAVERRAFALASDPARPLDGPPLTVLTFCEPILASRRELLLARGFAIVRETYQMRVDLPAPLMTAPVPEGIVVRPLRLGADDRLVYKADEEAFAQHFMHQPWSFEDWRVRNIEDEHLDPELWLVAWDGADVAGQVWAVPREDEGRIESLSVRKPWRGRGLGLALLRAVFARLAARGYPFARLHVDAHNETGALELYLKAGMRLERQFEAFEKDVNGSEAPVSSTEG